MKEKLKARWYRWWHTTLNFHMAINLYVPVKESVRRCTFIGCECGEVFWEEPAYHATNKSLLQQWRVNRSLAGKMQ